MIIAVTDTHPLLWYVGGRPGRIGRRALQAFEGAERGDGSALIYIPTIVLSECLRVFEAQEIHVEERFDDWVRRLDGHAFFSIAELRASTIIKSFEIHQIPDPFDRMIVATALDLELPLISSDTDIEDSHYVELLWD